MNKKLFDFDEKEYSSLFDFFPLDIDFPSWGKPCGLPEEIHDQVVVSLNPGADVISKF